MISNLQIPFRINRVKNLIFIGGGAILLQALSAARLYDINIRVVSSPRHLNDKINGKTLENHLIEQKIVYRSFEKFASDDFLSFCGDMSENLAISISSPWIFKYTSISQLFNYKLLNFHGAGLPKDRGSGGFSWRILMNNRLGYLTLHIVDDGIDTGPILIQKEFLFPKNCKIPIDYESTYINEAKEFFIDFFRDICTKGKDFYPIPQIEHFSTYWPRLNSDENSWLDWSLIPESLERFICAFDKPYLGARTLLNGLPVRLRTVMLTSGENYHAFQSGIIIRKAKNFILVALNNQSLIVEEILNEMEKNIIETVNVGDRFHTPQSYLDNSRNKRVFYNAQGISFIR